MTDKNIFGGGNPHGLYVPLSEDEQEVLDRLVESEDLEIIVHGWGVVSRPTVSFGDHRVAIAFDMHFNAPAVPMPVHFFDLELKSISTQMTLLRKRYPLMDNGGEPINICAGMSITLQWDIALLDMSPELVRAIKPGSFGLTSLRQDKDTKQMTGIGNMSLTDDQKKVLRYMDRQAEKVRAKDAEEAIQATRDAGYEIVETAGGIILPPV